MKYKSLPLLFETLRQLPDYKLPRGILNQQCKQYEDRSSVVKSDPN